MSILEVSAEFQTADDNYYRGLSVSRGDDLELYMKRKRIILVL